MRIDEKLKQWATEREALYVDAVNQHGSQTKAAKSVGVDKRTLERGLSRLKKRAALSGYSPEHGWINNQPDGFKVHGVSTLTKDADGNPQWVKAVADKARQEEALKEALEALNSQIKREKSVKPPKSTDDNLLNCYVITDYHLGMLGWGEETKSDDWDVGIAEDLLVNWFASAIKTAPNSCQAILAQLGDFLHHDGMESVTPENKNVLDADTRFQKMVRIAIRALRRVVRMLLEKHQSVHIIMAEGNHDPASSIWLREWFHALYEDEPRVTVDLSPDPYYCYEFGDTSLFFHHGHKRKPANIDDVFVSKYRDVFGRTKFSYGHMGHLHNQQVVETNLMLVEQHRTLASHDAYASRGGWISGRDAKCITYHRDYGEVGRITISPDMVKDGANESH